MQSCLSNARYAAGYAQPTEWSVQDDVSRTQGVRASHLESVGFRYRVTSTALSTRRAVLFPHTPASAPHINHVRNNHHRLVGIILSRAWLHMCDSSRQGLAVCGVVVVFIQPSPRAPYVVRAIHALYSDHYAGHTWTGTLYWGSPLPNYQQTCTRCTCKLISECELVAPAVTTVQPAYIA